MSYDISNIGTWTGSLSLLAWIVYIVFKCFVQESMKSRFAKELRNLKDKNQKELEGFKAGYQKVLDENQIRYSKLYAEQAEVIKELYKRLAILRSELNTLTAPLKMVPEDKDERAEYYKKLHQNVAVAHDNCLEYLSINEILLPDALCPAVYSFIKESRSVFFDYQDGSKKPSAQIEVHKKVTGELEEILKELQTSFRTILNGEEVQDAE